MKTTRFALFLAASLLFGAHPADAATTHNDASCDVAVMPAATLLLPYFEVDVNAPATSAVTTLFTVQNVGPAPQIANVTIWTDWAFPVVSFPIFLTGYDVQAINLYDVLARGLIAPPGLPHIDEPPPDNPTPGTQALPNTANPNFLPIAATQCNFLPYAVPAQLRREIVETLTSGTSQRPDLCSRQVSVGGAHAHAIGYVTIDVVATCSASVATDVDYVARLLLFDNMLTGDYQVVTPRGDADSYALASPLVHIRAIPEGGAGGELRATPLPYTFYGRLTADAPTRTFDRRQPLPSAFAARYVQAGATGPNSQLRIWREAVTGRTAACSAYVQNRDIPFVEAVRFDEHENATISGVTTGGFVPPPAVLPPTSTVKTDAPLFPFLSPYAGDVSGWLYLNLTNDGSSAYGGPRPSQNWVLVSTFAEPSRAVEYPATALGNGCSPARAADAQIAPSP